MEIQYLTVGAPRFAGMTAAQAAIEGDIPFPAGRSASDILMYMGDVVLEGSEVKDGLVLVEGRLKVQLVLTDSEGTYGFTSSAPLRHTLDIMEARIGMSARVCASLQTLEVKLSGSGDSISLIMCAVADISARLTDSSELQMMCGIVGAQELEFLERDVAAVTAAYQEQQVHNRDEVSAGDIVEVLCCDAAAELGERQGCGTVKVSALVKKSSGALSEECYTLPFEHDLPGAVCARVDSVYARCMSEEFSVIAIETRITLTAVDTSCREYSVPVDVYSPMEQFEPVLTKQCFISYAGHIEKRTELTESIALAPGMPAIHHAAYAACRAGITASGVQDGRLYIEGLLFTKIIYHTETGAYFSTSEDVPFSLELDAPGADIADVDIRPIACVRGCTADRIRVEYTLYISSELFSLTALSTVTGIGECGKVCPEHGVIVYFALEGESIFDVGKRFRIPTARIRAANPQSEERLSAGEKLMLLI